MPGRIEVDTPVAVGDAGLLLSLRRAQRQHGLLDRVDVVDRHVDVELLRHLRVGPGRCHVAGGELERQLPAGVGEVDPVVPASVATRCRRCPSACRPVANGNPEVFRVQPLPPRLRSRRRPAGRG